MDPWYSLGSHDMLDVAHMAVHACQMTGLDAMGACFRSVTDAGARAMRLDGYGLEVGAHADLVVLQARDEVEAVRLRPPRLQVIRRGRVIAESDPRVSRVAFGDAHHEVDWTPPLVG
jgi:cytosine deaminase